MDVSKLSPAPWRLSGCEKHPDGGKVICNKLRDANGKTVLSADDLEFAALARNAFEVMVRRGWSAHNTANKGLWFVDVPTRRPFDGGSIRIKADDPFTALVEADAWYAANIEGGGTA